MPPAPDRFDQLLVLSDIHLPLDPTLSSYAGEGLLGPALRAWCKPAEGTLLVLNGDVLDLLTDDDALDGSDVAGAARRVTEILKRAPGAELAATLGELLTGGATVVVRPGNHDLELAHPRVQAAFREAVGAAGDLRFSTEPVDAFQVGGLRVLVAHGDGSDLNNQFDLAAAQAGTFVYPPGSKVVKAVVNPAKRAGLAFIDQMEPMIEGAVATAALVDPDAISPSAAQTLDVLRHVARRKTGDPMGLLSLRETYDSIATWFQQRATTTDFVRRLQPFPALEDLEPSDDEAAYAAACVEEAKGAHVVILGHTHQPRLADLRTAVFANPGSWTWRLAGPGATEGPAAWDTFVQRLKDDRGLTSTAAQLKVRQPGAVRVDGAGRAVSLLRWRDDRAHAVRLIPTERNANNGPSALTTVAASTDRLGALKKAVAERLQPDAALDLSDQLLPDRLRGLMLTLVQQALDSDGPHRAIHAETVWRLYEEARADRLAAREADRLRHLDALAREGYRVVRAVASTAGFSVHARAEEPLIRLVPAASPLTWRRDLPLRLQRAAEDHDYIEVSLDALPFPVVTFPPDWLSQPRWPAVLLHELGHDLDADLGLTPALQAAKWSKDVREGTFWSSWTSEIVADLMMLALCGPPAVLVLDQVLAAVLGYRGLADLHHPHPPAVLRVELLRAASAALFGGDEGEISDNRIAERELRDVPDAERAQQEALIASAKEAAAALLRPRAENPDASPFGDLLRAVAAADRPWCQAIASDGERPATTGPGRDDAEAWARLAAQWLKDAAPTFGLDPDTLHKAPPHALLIQHDRAAFVGETNNQLPAALATASRLRGTDSKWSRLEVFYLDRAAVAAMATKDRPFEARWAAREASLAKLRELLPELCDSFQLYEHSDASLFASFWGPADEDAPWSHVHTSARVWGGEIQRAPAIDYRAHPNRPNLQLKALAEGLEWLRKTAKKLNPV